MAKIVSVRFVDDGIYGYVRDEERRLEVASVAGEVAGVGRKQPETATHISSLFTPRATARRESRRRRLGHSGRRSGLLGVTVRWWWQAEIAWSGGVAGGLRRGRRTRERERTRGREM